MASSVEIREIKPTVFFIRDGDHLLLRIAVTIESASDLEGCSIAMIVPTGSYAVPITKLTKGKQTYTIDLPDFRETCLVKFHLLQEGTIYHEFECEWEPTKQWEVFFVPNTHHDLGYTDPIEELLEHYNTFYDDVIRYCEETELFPEDARYRYTVEETWSLLHYIRNRPPETVNKLIQLAKQGRIEVSALFANVIDAMCGHEELIRLLYPSFQLERKYGIPITTASMVDIPGLSWGLATVLAQAGIRYLFAGLPTYFEWEGQDIHTFWDEEAVLSNGRPGAFYWEGPDGSRVLTYYCGGYGWLMGGDLAAVFKPGSFQDVHEHLPGFLMQMQDSPFSVVRYVDHGVDNFPPQKTISEIVREWNRRYAYPRLIVSTNHMFFEELEKQCDQIPVFRGELPHTDYAVCATSAAKEAAINRITHSVAQTAESLSAVNTVLTGSAYPADTIRKIYENMLLFDEHCYGMSQPLGKVQDWNWNTKSGYAFRAAALSQKLLAETVASIASHIRHDHENARITVFNPVGFERNEVVRIDNFPMDEESMVIIDESTGLRIPHQIVTIDRPNLPLPYASERYAMGKVGTHFTAFARTLVFVAESLPPLGYRNYKLVHRSADNPVDSSIYVENNLLENRFYRIELDPASGAVASIFDKELGMELVDRDAPHQLNQLVVRSIEDGKLDIPFRITMEVGEKGPVYASIRIFSEAAGCPRVVQEIIMYDKLKKIETANRLLKDATPFQEIYFAFPFGLKHPTFRFEGTNSVIVPFRDQLPGSNTNHYTVQHWAEVSDGKACIVFTPIEAHTLEFGGLWPCYVSQAHHGIDPVDYGQPFVDKEQIVNGHMYSLVMNSNYRTNFAPVQQSDVLFRYAFTSSGPDGSAADARRFGWSSALQPVAVHSQPQAGGKLHGELAFCLVEPDNVFLLTLKQAEDENGFILRLMETEGRPADAVVKLPYLKIVQAYAASNVEKNECLLVASQQEFHVSIPANGTVTVRVETSDAHEKGVAQFHNRIHQNRAQY